jgi:hypothetical protein
MRQSNDMRDLDFETQVIEIDDPVESNEQGFGVAICQYIHD